VDNIAQDPLWEQYRHLVLLGYQACWSTLICNSQHQPIGTFAFSGATGRSSQDFHQKLIDACTHLCALALERESDRHRIRQLAFYDGWPNRALLRAKADQAIASAVRNQEQLAVLFIDLDRFKQVNDSLGHGAGDELLRTMAARLQQVLRANDIVGRLSGDEFAAVLSQCDAVHATNTIERLQVLLAEPLTIKKPPVSVCQHRHCPLSRRWTRFRDAAAACRHGHVPSQKRRQRQVLFLQPRNEPCCTGETDVGDGAAQGFA
jgi:diguanylate cyclase (GGDEF)-like protein